MPFGKDLGWNLEDLPDSYLTFIADFDDLRSPLREGLDVEVLRRQPGSSKIQGVRRAEMTPRAREFAEQIIDMGYRRLSLIHHPDRGGELAEMQTLNLASAWLRSGLRNAL